MNPRNPHISLILLAAGGSTRLGRPKQLLKFGPMTLIRKLATEALASKADEVIVVIGADAASVRAELNELDVTVVENSDWPRGLSTSIVAGLKSVSNDCAGVLLLLSDQPYVKRELLNRIIEEFRTKLPLIVACEYGATVGVPALFSKSLFPELMKLKGDSGAKSVILAHKEKVERIPFPKGIVDIDTPADLKELLR